MRRFVQLDPNIPNGPDDTDAELLQALMATLDDIRERAALAQRPPKK
jgi:hypothetical protein